MKYTLLALVILVSSMTCRAQEEESTFGVFYALPVGSFSSTDISDGGFAKPGWGLVFDSESHYKFLPENMSLYFHSTYQWNKMDNEKVSQAFTQALGARTVASESRYSPLLTTIGPAYTFALSEKVKLGINGSVGIMFNNTRAFSIRVYDDADEEIFHETINFDNDVAFAYVVGIELKFPLVADIMGGSIYADYTGAKQNTTLSFDNIDPIKSFQKIRYLNIGFRFVLPKKKPA